MSINRPGSAIRALASPWQAPFGAQLAAEAGELFRDAAPNALIFLISVGGLDCQDLPMSGSLQQTPALARCPTLRTLLACFTAPLGRVYLRHTPSSEGPSPRGMGANATQASALLCYHPPSQGLIYHTLKLSLAPHISLLVELRRGQGQVSEFFDRQRLQRIEQGDIPCGEPISLPLAEPRLDLLPPATLDALIADLAPALASLPHTERESLTARLAEFSRRWRECHQHFGDDFDGEWAYASALNYLEEQVALGLRPLLAQADAPGREDALYALDTLTSQLKPFPPPPHRIDRQTLARARNHKPRQINERDRRPEFDRPIFIVSAPRAGSTLLFETLSHFRDLWTTGEENHESIEAIPGLHPKDHGFHSNRLTAADATPQVREALMTAFCARLRDRDQRYYLDLPPQERPARIRLLEKTPKNALRIPFLKQLFPDAGFVYLQRDREPNVSSLIEGWRSRRFIAYRHLPGLANRHWSFLLTPNWRELTHKSLAAIADHQWRSANRIIAEDLAQLPADRWMKIEYNELVRDTRGVLDRFARFADLPPDAETEAMGERPPRLSRLTLSAPRAEKWKKHAHFFDLLDGAQNAPT